MLFSEARRGGDLLYLSGVVGVGGGSKAELSFEAELRRALELVEARLHAHGSAWPLVVDVTIFLGDMALYERLNVVYREYFAERLAGAPLPARTCVAVKGLPLNARVELKAVATAV